MNTGFLIEFYEQRTSHAHRVTTYQVRVTSLGTGHKALIVANHVCPTELYALKKMLRQAFPKQPKREESWKRFF